LEQLENNPRPEPKWYGARILAGSVAGILLSLGLCGLGSSFHLGTGIGVLSTLGIFLFFASILGIVVGVITLIIEAIAAAARR
jgi:hypothetical protein